MKKLSDENVKLILERHKNNVSILQIARELGVCPSSVRYHLKRDGFSPNKILGKDQEKMVTTLEEINGKKVTIMPIHHPFDLLIDGVRVDVKSARPSKVKLQKRYLFQLQDLTQRKVVKKLKDLIDTYYLVFKDTGEVWSLGAEFVNCKSSLSIGIPMERSKYYRFLTKVGNIAKD